VVSLRAPCPPFHQALVVVVAHVVAAAQVSELKVRYLDSIPTCSSLCILKSGFLYGAAEFGNHALYQFQGVGDDDDSPVRIQMIVHGWPMDH